MSIFDMLLTKGIMGGGSSDFTTATVTIIDNTTASVAWRISLPIIDGDILYGYLGGEWATGEKQVVLYKNYCEGDIFVTYGDAGSVKVESTGGVHNEDTFVSVTGDGTLTISMKD